MKMPALMVGCGVLFAALMSGCSSYSSPTLQVTEARVTERTGEGVALAFVMDAANTNDEPLPLRRATYALELDGKRVFEGVRSAEATLRRRGTQQIVLPAGIPLAMMPGGVVRYRLTGSVEYVTPGAFAEVLFDTGARRPDASFVQEGTIDLASAPAPIPSTLPAAPVAPAANQDGEDR